MKFTKYRVIHSSGDPKEEKLVRPNLFSIASLTGVFITALLGLGMLRHASEAWADVTVLATFGVFALTVVGAVYGEKTERIWWLGFTLFGWGYLYLALTLHNDPRVLPTLVLLDALMSKLGAELPRTNEGNRIEDIKPPIQLVGHCLWGLMLAGIGGMLAHAAFAFRKELPKVSATSPQSPISSPRLRWRWWPIALGLVCVVMSMVLLTNRFPALVTGAMLMLTWGVLGITILGAVCNWGKVRPRYLGAALFGTGYLLLIFGPDPKQPTWSHIAIDDFIRAFCPWIPPIERGQPPSSPESAAANARVREALEMPVPMNFPNETPLKEFLEYVRVATRDVNGVGMSIVVDPGDLEPGEFSEFMQATVSIEVEGVALRTTLELALRQLGRTYEIRDGVLVIVYKNDSETEMFREDPRLVVGHCLLALLMAGIGALIAPLVAGVRDDLAQSIALS